MAKKTVREMLSDDPWRLKQAARKWGVSKTTVWEWITHGRPRSTDGKVVHLTAIKGPDGGYRTNQEAYVRFFEELNGGKAQ